MELIVAEQVLLMADATFRFTNKATGIVFILNQVLLILVSNILLFLIKRLPLDINKEQHLVIFFRYKQTIAFI
jgi:hypothetical protein